jgi:transposase
MTTQTAVEISLNLPNVRILACNENGKEYMVRASSVEPQRACPECPSEDAIGFGTKEQKIMDLPMHGKQVGINFIRQRFRCKACEYTFYEPIYFADEKRHATRRFVEHLEEQTLRRSHTSLALEFGLDEKTVRNIFRDYVSRLAETVKFETPTRMGIDEIHILDQPRAVITNIENRTIVDLLPNRKKDAIVAYLKNMPDKERVRVVAMDMWQPYRDAVREVLPWATSVVDKFHIQRMGNVAIENVRKALRKQLPKKARLILKDDRFVLLKRRKDLLPYQVERLNDWLDSFPFLAEGYALKESYYEVWDATSKAEAISRYLDWKKRISPEMEPFFSDIVRAMPNWEKEIMAYFDHSVTNAYTESLNSLIRAMNRIGRGYSFDALRAKILFTQGFVKKKPKPTSLRARRKAEEMSWADVTMDWVGAEANEPEIYLGADIDKLVQYFESEHVRD